MENLKWRLSKLPTVEELTSLEEKKILTKEEVKKILFNNETVEDIDKDSLKGEIKFLRELIEKLADKAKIVSTVYEYHHTYETKPWYQPYYYWCSSGTCGGNYTTGASALNCLTAIDGTVYGTTTGSNPVNCAYAASDAGSVDFSKIQTF